jgi:hypothetical protein
MRHAANIDQQILSQYQGEADVTWSATGRRATMASLGSTMLGSGDVEPLDRRRPGTLASHAALT